MKRRLLGTQENYPKNIKTLKFPQRSCFDIDIDTILANPHSCLLIDIGLISMIWEISLNGSSGLLGARLFQN